MLRAVIFDFDGTVADTIPAIREGINLTMRLYGYPEHDLDSVRSFVNHGARELIRSAIPAALRRDEEQVSRVLADYDRLYGTVYNQTRVAYDGIPEVFRILHRTYRTGVLSNKQDQFVKKLSEQVLFPGSFDAAQGVIPGVPTKPDPALSLMIAQSLGVTPSECVMIGDSDVDIATAANAGMLHIGVSWGYRDEAFLRAHGAVRVVNRPEELLPLIESIKQE